MSLQTFSFHPLSLSQSPKPLRTINSDLMVLNVELSYRQRVRFSSFTCSVNLITFGCIRTDYLRQTDMNFKPLIPNIALGDNYFSSFLISSN